MSTRTRIDDQKKDHIDPKGPPQGSHLKQLLIHNLPTNDVENINRTNKWRDLLLAIKPQIFFLKNGKDATKDPEAQQSYFT